jgi:hypothetical protein
VIIATVANPALAREWTERYFGVGSAADQSAACAEAREHAEVNSAEACKGGSGSRGAASYTACICARMPEGVHMCNVNLKVLCDGPMHSGGDGSRPRGEPKGRADGRSSVHWFGRGVRAVRPGPEVSSCRW